MAENWNTMVVLDVETSGKTSPSKNQILTISASVVNRKRVSENEDGGKPAYTFEIEPNNFETKIARQPWARIEKEALEITGITLDKSWRGIPEDQALQNLVNWIRSTTGDGYRLLCGYNVVFDKRFLHFLFERNKHVGRWTHGFSYRYLDVLQLAQWAHVLGFITEPPNFKLETMAMHLDVWEEGAHASDVDVLMTIKIMERLNQIMRLNNASN